MSRSRTDSGVAEEAQSAAGDFMPATTFLDGASRIWDFAGARSRLSKFAAIDTEDMSGLAADWLAIGGDLQKQFGELRRTGYLKELMAELTEERTVQESRPPQLHAKKKKKKRR